MDQQIASGTFYILVVVTMVLQIIMWYRRSQFLRTIKEQENAIVNQNGSQVEALGIMLQIVVPVKLAAVEGGHLQELRKSAVKASRHFMLSLLLTLILPILLFVLTK